MNQTVFDILAWTAAVIGGGMLMWYQLWVLPERAQKLPDRADADAQLHVGIDLAGIADRDGGE